MSEWTLQHPWMTFFLVVFGMSTISNVFGTIFSRKKQEKTPQPQLGITKLVIQRAEDLPRKPDDDELN